MSDRDELVTLAKAEVERTFVEYGDEAGRGIHSWRCEYPDRYGPCDCVEGFARDASARLADVLIAAGWTKPRTADGAHGPTNLNEENR